MSSIQGPVPRESYWPSAHDHDKLDLLALLLLALPVTAMTPPALALGFLFTKHSVLLSPRLGPLAESLTRVVNLLPLAPTAAFAILHLSIGHTLAEIVRTASRTMTGRENGFASRGTGICSVHDD